MSAMVPQRRLASLLKSCWSDAYRETPRRMSIDPKGIDGMKSLSSHSVSRVDRTWNLFNGITFQGSKRKTWNPTPGLHISSSDQSTTAVSALSAQGHTTRYCGGYQILPAVAQKSLIGSEPEQGLAFSQLSLSGTSPRSKLPQPSRPISSEIKNQIDLGVNSPLPPSNGNEDAGYQQSSKEPFRTPLGFHIPQAKLKSLGDAAPSSPAACWQYRLYQGPDGEYDKVKVHYCKNRVDTEKVAQLYLNEDVVGFDIEWKMNAVATDGISKNVSLIQVASERRAALFHIARYPNAGGRDDFVAPSLKKLMESPGITKVGVSIKGDCTRLRNHLGINSRGLFELSHLYKLVKYANGDVKKINKMLAPLADQVEEHLGLPLWKGDVRSSDWSQDLKEDQIKYAASDAYAGFQLFHMLEYKRKALHPTPPRPAHAELNLPIRLADGLSATRPEETIEVIEDSINTSDENSIISVEELTNNFKKIVFQDSARDSTPKASAISSSKEKSTTLPPSPEITLANNWIDHFKASANTRNVAKPAELRAYALWHEQELDIPRIASLLRDPPLQNATVTNYIGRALQSTSLPYRMDRIKELEQYIGASGIPGVNWRKLKQGSGNRE